MGTVHLEEPAVGRIVVGNWEGGQGLPEILRQGQMLWGRVLELGEFHFILQDDQPVSLRQTSTGINWLTGKQVEELKGQREPHLTLMDRFKKLAPIVSPQGATLNVLHVGPGALK